MLAGLPTQVPDGAGDDEFVECAIEAGGQLVDGIVTLVGVRDEILAIVDRPHDRLTGRLVEEHLLGTEVRRWRV